MKRYKVILNSSIPQKLENIFSYIALDSKIKAINILTGIEKEIMFLQYFPEKFPIIPENIEYKKFKIRHFFHKKSFRIIYLFDLKKVRILDIRHSRSNLYLKIEIN
jgi:plasmid stabilization system protein ParE